MSRSPVARVSFLVCFLGGCASQQLPLPPEPIVLEPPTFDLASAMRGFTGTGTLTEGGGEHAARRSTPRMQEVAAIDAGVLPECEIYLERVQSCIGKLPMSSHAALLQAAAEMRSAWLAITDPAGREALREECAAGAETWGSLPDCR